MKQKLIGVGVALGIGLSLLILLVAMLIVVYSGTYNIAATEDHTPLVRWAFTTTMHSSAKSRARDISPPERFTQAMVSKGATEYKAMCQHCHAGPGVERSEWAGGMLPQPPHLMEEAAEWEPNEIFWLVKNGVKMTGMPAFGPTHSDEALWNVVAFVRLLPGMTAQEYAGYDDQDTHGH